MFTIKETSADSLLALRWRVLRPGRPESTTHFPGDDLPTTRHFAALDQKGEVIGCASVLEADSRLQLRGMATAPEWQGKGVGRAVLEAVHQYASHRALPLWCNARVSAVGFYEKNGWQVEGDRFEVPDVGPHYKMHYVTGRLPGPESPRLMPPTTKRPEAA
ncbi:GNAT family N-acetyltransferase [Armatimonas rosea]|uniref:GNAT superfamily N-acetyltransferase n=1 Tax=Armatimonas rosea TaxID=685828 RepID=A0A7W9SP60_ARMRO|nr:GNAT superfamily N-acetyltransferase [Armatimonas rosea]